MDIKNNQSEISIIIPVYNGAETIEKCLKSVMNQSLTPKECIVVNDGSTDETYNILEEMKKVYSKLKVYHRQNAGVSAARNYAISQIDRGGVCSICRC